jgi:hypothetical protein
MQRVPGGLGRDRDRALSGMGWAGGRRTTASGRQAGGLDETVDGRRRMGRSVEAVFKIDQKAGLRFYAPRRRPGVRFCRFPDGDSRRPRSRQDGSAVRMGG